MSYGIEENIADIVQEVDEQNRSYGGVTLSAYGRQKLTAALLDVSQVWNVVSNGQPLLEWSPEGDEVSPEFFERLAEAVRRLQGHGFGLSIGRSSRGYTYLNITGLDGEVDLFEKYEENG